VGRVLQRRALLVSPGGPIKATLRRARKALRLVAGGRAPCPQIGQLRPCLPRIGLVPARVTFVIDRQGIVRHRFESNVNMGAHVVEALKIVQTLTTSPA